VTPSLPVACAFCSIIRGESDAHVVVDDDAVVAFLDRRPLFEGHVLVVPREHHETLADLPAELVGPLFERVRTLERVLEGPWAADGTFVAANNKVSQSVPHLHVHVVPRHRKDGLRGFFWPRMRYESDERMAEVAATLRAAYDEVVAST
jgi:histidine triad (HIT) family protein